jgi:hypothetical protein
VPTYQIQAAVAGAGPFALGESPVVGYSLVDGATPLASFAISPTTGITSYLWEIWSTAGGVSAVLSSTTAAAPTFPLQADTAGTYLLRCTINGTTVAKIGVSVTTATRALRIPAAGEQLEFGTDGWATAVQALIAAVQADGALPFALAGATKVTTGSAGAGGGTVDFALPVGVRTGQAWRLRIRAIGNTVNSDIALYADAGRTDVIWPATAQDCFTAPYMDCKVGFPLLATDGSALDGNLYGTITNNGANPSAYEVEVWGAGVA